MSIITCKVNLWLSVFRLHTFLKTCKRRKTMRQKRGKRKLPIFSSNVSAHTHTHTYIPLIFFVNFAQLCAVRLLFSSFSPVFFFFFFCTTSVLLLSQLIYNGKTKWALNNSTAHTHSAHQLNWANILSAVVVRCAAVAETEAAAAAAVAKMATGGQVGIYLFAPIPLQKSSVCLCVQSVLLLLVLEVVDGVGQHWTLNTVPDSGGGSEHWAEKNGQTLCQMLCTGAHLCSPVSAFSDVQAQHSLFHHSSFQ